MLQMTHVTKTFPSVHLPSAAQGLPVEVSLIAQLGHGAGNHLLYSVASRQRQHAAFIDELDEPSAKLAATDFSKGDATALYSFIVGPQGHPFHRHAGHRIFTAISGSGGAQLRFSSASSEQIARDPQNFIKALRFVNIPPDCLFTVRFGGETWHQFAPINKNSVHPVFFALSCHTNELGGDLPPPLREQVLRDAADIPSLTELLPESVALLLNDPDFAAEKVPTTTLALDAPAGSLHRSACDITRGSLGILRGAWAAWRSAGGFSSQAGMFGAVTAKETLPEGSLLESYFSGLPIHHVDSFVMPVTGLSLQGSKASVLLAHLLEGFLRNPPKGVTALMLLRNALVKPLGLRTSPLGCPVSSLLSQGKERVFMGKYPVLEERIDAQDGFAEVVLGADDRHLSFRSSVSLRICDAHTAEITLANKIHCKNLFGRFYIASIHAVHRRYIAPAMLRMAADHAVRYFGLKRE